MYSFLVFVFGAVALVVAPFWAASAFVLFHVFLGAWRYGWRDVARQGARQIWRLKWLLIVSFVLMAMPVPGAPINPGWPDFLPSREGVTLAAEQCLRVAFVILLFAAQPGMLSTTDRVAALYRLLTFFGSRGERAALRIGLTLRELENARREDHWAALRGAPWNDAGETRWCIESRGMESSERWWLGLAALGFALCLAANVGPA